MEREKEMTNEEMNKILNKIIKGDWQTPKARMLILNQELLKIATEAGC